MLFAEIKGFEGTFPNLAPTYATELIIIDFYGTFTKAEQVHKGAVDQGKVLLTLDPNIIGKLELLEGQENTKLPREGEFFKIEIQGPFEDIQITEKRDDWDRLADQAFRK